MWWLLGCISWSSAHILSHGWILDCCCPTTEVLVLYQQWMPVFVRFFVWKYLTRRNSLILVNKVLNDLETYAVQTLLHTGVVSVSAGGRSTSSYARVCIYEQYTLGRH